MLSRPSSLLTAVVAALAAGLATSACERAPLLAPTGSSITLTTATTALPANGTATIIAQVMESAGTPPHSGTRVTFTTTLGTIDPVDASTDASGRAVVTFRAGGASGVAIIAANSGGASTSTGSTGTGSGSGGTGGTTTDRNLRIAVGAAAVGRVIVAATPSILPTSGGNVTIAANVLDINGNPLSAAPVTFTSTAGSLSAPSVNTDASGNASVILTTFQTATVTATVGLGSTGTGGTGSGGSGSGGNGGSSGTTNNQASVTVSLTSAPTLVITPPTTPPSAGLPSSFTFRVTPATTSGGSGGSGGNNGGTTSGTIQVRDLLVDWGDGSGITNLGGVSGEQAVTHTYRDAGTYLITATVTDIAGGSSRVSTSVTVIPVPRPSIIVTPTPQSIAGGGTITFRIEITAPTGLAIQNVVINYGDNNTDSLGGASGVLSVPHTYPATPRSYPVTVTVTDSSGQTTTGSTTVSITN